jgi:hypothetical protein
MTDRPRVTQILSDLGFTRYFGHNERPMALGRAVHKAIHYAEKGTLDWTHLHPDLTGPLAAFQKVTLEKGLRVLATEMALVHPTWNYAGHPDWVGEATASDGLVLVDWKVSESPDLKTATLQLAGYKMLWESNHPDQPITRCYVGRLGKDGTYSFPDVTNPEAEQQFMACVIVWRALQERNRV